MSARKLNGSIVDGRFVPGTGEAVWFFNDNDPAPLRFPLNRNAKWLGGQGIVGRDSVQEDPTFRERYSGGIYMDGRVMWSEDQTGTGYVILKALKGGAESTYEELRDFYVCHGSPPGGMTAKDFEDLVGRPDEGAAPGASRPGSARWNAIPRTRTDLFHGDYWIAADGLWYINENRANPRPLLPNPLGTSTSGGGGVSAEDDARLRRQYDEAIAKLAQVRTTAAALVTAHPSGAGAPLREWAAKTKVKLDEIAKLAAPIVLLCMLLVPAIGCRTLGPPQIDPPAGSGSIVRRIIAGVFTRAALADLQLEGSVAAESTDIALELVAERAPELVRAVNIALELGVIEAVGPRLLPLSVKGEAEPRWIICRRRSAPECAALKVNTPVRAFVQPIGLGHQIVYILHRVTPL